MRTVTTVSLPYRERNKGRSDAMDQPTAGEAPRRLEPLVGEWTPEARPPHGRAWETDFRLTYRRAG
jgi:hypothetical protein